MVLAYSARGFGRSGGLIHLDAPDYEVADAQKLISYLATLPQVELDGPGDPRVGVAGSSYGGGLALMLAGADRRVDAVGADIAWNDLQQALFPNAAGGEPGVFKKQWAGELFGSTIKPGEGACGRFAADLCADYQRAASTGQPDAADPVPAGGLQPEIDLEQDHGADVVVAGRAGFAVPAGAGRRQCPRDRRQRHRGEGDLARRRP